MKIVVIVPTYNEKENISRMIPVLEEEIFPKITSDQMHILVIDDYSPDGTPDVVKQFMKKYKNIELNLGAKEGLGAAYVRGMHYAMDKMDADAVIEFDADFQHDPHDIPRLVAEFDAGYDYVIGSRYVKGGKIPRDWGLDRKIKSIFGSFLARIVLFQFNLHDMTSGLKLSRTSYLKKIDLDHLYSKNFSYKMQILYEVAKKGAKIKEIPITFYDRTSGKSKMDPNDMIESLSVIFRLRLRDSARFIKFLFVGGTGFIVQLVFQEGAVFLGINHPTGVAIGAESAIISNFLLNNFWTFSDTQKLKQRDNFFVRLLKFNIASLGAIVIQYAADFLAEHFFGPTMHVGALSAPTRIVILFPVIIFLVIPLNYVIYNVFIWKTKYLKNEVTTKA